MAFKRRSLEFMVFRAPCARPDRAERLSARPYPFHARQLPAGTAGTIRSESAGSDIRQNGGDADHHLGEQTHEGEAQT